VCDMIASIHACIYSMHIQQMSLARFYGQGYNVCAMFKYMFVVKAIERICEGSTMCKRVREHDESQHPFGMETI